MIASESHFAAAREREPIGWLFFGHGMPRSPGGLETINASLRFSKKSLNALDIYWSIDLYKVCQDRDRTRDGEVSI